jgi:DAK2 domain fusion protein YloV
MTLTVRAVVDALDAAPAGTSRDLADAVTRACLMGARGNSGVILSQLVRGALEPLAGEATVDADALARSLRAASDAGYAAVREPQEGTILTLARALAESAEEAAAAGRALADALADVVAGGEAALARTPEQLAVLRDAGVVDAGGAGLVEILRGIAAEIRGEPLPEPTALGETIPLEAAHIEGSRYRYCTSFFVEGDDVDPERLEADLERLGDSLLVVGTPGAVKAHLHTDEPGAALAVATAAGVVEEVDVRNMHVQTAARSERLTRELATSAAVAVCIGEGNNRLFESLGAVCVEGGKSMNPSTAELLEAVGSLAAEGVVLLPNSKNVVLAAEQAAAEAKPLTRVVPTRSLQAGLAAMVAFDATRPVEENCVLMAEAAHGVRAGAVARASRDAVVDGVAVQEGHFLGLVDEHAVSAGPELEAVARSVLERLLVGGADVLTVLVGQDVVGADDLVRELLGGFDELEVDVHIGGQPHYPLLLSAE